MSDYNSNNTTLNNEVILERPSIRSQQRRKPSLHRLMIELDDYDSNNDGRSGSAMSHDQDINYYETPVKSVQTTSIHRNKSGASSVDSAVIPDSPESRPRKKLAPSAIAQPPPLTKKEMKRTIQLERQNAALKQRLVESEIHIANLWRKVASAASSERVGSKTLRPAKHGTICEHCGCEVHVPKFARVLGLPINPVETARARRNSYSIARARGASSKVATLLSKQIKPFYVLEREMAARKVAIVVAGTAGGSTSLVVS